jgi:type VI secretion system secreted protein VgrG
MTATEQLGRLFECEMELLSERPDIELADLLGGKMTVRVALPEASGGNSAARESGLSARETRTRVDSTDEERRSSRETRGGAGGGDAGGGAGGTRYFNGFVTRFSYLGAHGRYHLYQATLGPWLWFLTRVADCRIFQKLTVPQIIERVFDERGFTDYRKALSGDYRQWEYCVQYRETDFNFVSRLMEQEGIYYYFEHEDGKHTLVLADDYGAHAPFAGYAEVPYYPPDNMQLRERDHLYEWKMAKQVQPGGYALTDFDFKAPNKELRKVRSMPKNHVMANFEVYDYPGDYTEATDGDNYVKIRLQELLAQHEVLHGQGNARGLATGYVFNLTNCGRDDQNREYLIVAAQYECTGGAYESTPDLNPDQPFQARITAIDARQPYRAPRITPKPVVRGPQTAIVVGPSGEEIYTDQYGRVKCHFHWDRYGKADQDSSCWIRVAQVWAGKRWGAMYIPRIGHEVIVEFLEGDPDQPIITGRVYNGTSMPPYPLPDYATLSGIKSLSSKGGGGFNEIRFEDKKGEEQIFIHAEKNQDLRIKEKRFEWIGIDRHLIVKQDKFEHVENSRHEIVDNDHREHIKNDRNVKVGGKEAISIGASHSLTVSGNVIEVFKQDHCEQTTGNYYLKALGVVIEATTGITLKCGASNIVIDPTGVTIKGAIITLDGGLVKVNSGPGSPAVPGVALPAVPPAAPGQALEADKADPGEVTEVKAQQIQKKAGKYGSVPVKPFKPIQDDGGGGGQSPRPAPSSSPEQKKKEDKKKHWIEIDLVDDEGKPVPGEPYEIKMPDGSVKKGSLDENGFARVDGIEDPGNCEITFPNRDKKAWERA